MAQGRRGEGVLAGEQGARGGHDVARTRTVVAAREREEKTRESVEESEQARAAGAAAGGGFLTGLEEGERRPITQARHDGGAQD